MIENVDAGPDREVLLRAAEIIINAQRGSQVLLRKRLRIGFARAVRLMALLEQAGIVGPPNGPKPRDVLVKATERSAVLTILRQDYVPGPVYCSSPSHARNTPAAARLIWPDGPFKPETACMADLYNHLSTARANGDALNIELFGSNP